MSDDVSSDLTLNPIARLTRDLRQGAATLGDTEARFLVDAYYTMQEDRKRAKNQERALGASGEPHSMITWLADQAKTLESQITSALDVYTQNHVMGSWMRNVYGIGPVLSAGLLAHIYMGQWCQVCHGHDPADHERQMADNKMKFPPHSWTPVISCRTVGQIYQFAGIAGAGQRPWEKGKPRPWNAELRTLCWKVGQSFMKFSNDEKCYYGRIYREQKKRLTEYNDNGRYKEEVEARLTGARGTPTPDARVWLERGLLPPAAIDGRARRYAVKLFLSHLFEEWFRRQHGTEPPAPFAIGILKHESAHYIPPPPIH